MVSLQGLAVAEGGNRCSGAAGSLTVSAARCLDEKKAGGPVRSKVRFCLW